MLIGNRERALRARARGTVLELTAGVELDELARRDDRFDTILSIFFLARQRDPRRVVQTVARLLAPDGQVLVLEPTATPGLAGSLQRFAGRGAPDVPALFRSCDLSLSECDRIRTAAGSYVEAVAFHTISPARPVATR